MLLSAGAVTDSANPISKVVQLISSLEANIIQEAAETQSAYQEMESWCRSRSQKLMHEIKSSKAQVEDLEAAIEKANDDVEAMGTKIEELSSSISTGSADVQASELINKKETEDFQAEQKDLSDMIVILERSIQILEKSSSGASFAQGVAGADVLEKVIAEVVQAHSLSTAGTERLTSLIQNSQTLEDDMSDSEGSLGAPEGAAYQSKSGGVIETMEGLLDKAQAQLETLRQREGDRRLAYLRFTVPLKDQVKIAKGDMADAKQERGEAGEKKATAQGDLAVSKKAMAEDTKSLEELHRICMSKAHDFEEETSSRNDELKALAEAKKAVVEATGGAEKAAYGSASAASFVQVSSDGAPSAGARVLHLLHDLAQKRHSKALMQLASRFGAVLHSTGGHGANPFAKVRGIIEAMVKKLEKDAEAEANHKAYCDQEMGHTKSKQDDKEADVEKLSTKVDQLTARNTKLKEEVSDLQSELSDLATAQKEMDAIRERDHESNMRVKKDMEDGIKGVQMALEILRKFYATGDKGSGSGAASGIIGLLEVAESDFSKGLSEVVSDEKGAQTNFEEQTAENARSKAAKEQDVKYKSAESKSTDKAISELSSDRDGVQTELDAVKEYYAKLQNECVAKAEPYEEKAKRRAEDIASLKEGLSILEGEAMFLQTHMTHTLRGTRRHVIA